MHIYSNVHTHIHRLDIMHLIPGDIPTFSSKSYLATFADLWAGWIRPR